MPAHKYTNCWMLAVNDFCKQVVENGKIVVNSSSKVERDFVPISLLCNSIHTMIDDVEVNSGIINIASSNTVSLQEITNIIKERTELLFGFSVEVMFKNKSGFSLDSSNSKKLFISNHKLKETVEVEIKLVGEIDQLLLMCRKWFG